MTTEVCDREKIYDNDNGADFKENNYLAIENINDDVSEGYNVFIITILKL